MNTNLENKRKSIGQVAKELDLQTHVIRFWESKFPKIIIPEIGKGNRRYYNKKMTEALKKIKKLLYEDGYTILGLQKLLKRKNTKVINGKNIQEDLLNMIEDVELKLNEIELMFSLS